jgi:hypothetical protein
MDLAEIGAARPVQYVLTLRPISLADANVFVDKNHRHHPPVQGHKFSLAAFAQGELVGVAIVGRPVARLQDEDTTLEVTRLATNGCPNACSFLYAAARRAAQALGYARIITYILATEPGTSLKAAGWRRSHTVLPTTWNRWDRDRLDVHPLGEKACWEAKLREGAKITSEISSLAKLYDLRAE